MTKNCDDSCKCYKLFFDSRPYCAAMGKFINNYDCVIKETIHDNDVIRMIKYGHTDCPPIDISNDECKQMTCNDCWIDYIKHNYVIDDEK